MRFLSVFLLLFFMLQGQLFSQNAQFFLNQGKLYYEMQEYEDAINEFELALEFPNPTPDLYVYLASAHLLNGNPERAVKRAKQGLELFDGFLRLRVMKGEGFVKFDRPAAIVTFESVYDDIKATGESQLDGIHAETIKAYLSHLYQQEAVHAFDEKDFDSAIFNYQSARELNPDSLSIHNNLSYILIQQENFEKAEDAIDYGLQYFPDAENLLLMKAQIYDKKEDHEKMAGVLGRLYRVDPENIDRAVLYGKSLLNANQAQKANLFFREKIEQYPKERTLYRALIDINRQRFNQSGLLEVLYQKKNRFPDDLDILEEYGLELITAQRFEDANTFFDSLAAEYQNPEYARLSNHAYLYDEEYEIAEEGYRRHLEQWPENPDLLREFGLLLVETGKVEEARTVMEKYLRKNEDGRIRIQYAMLTDDVARKEEILKPLKNTIYEGQADWILARYSDISDKEFYITTLISIIELYNSRQETVQEEARIGLNRFRAPSPPLLQTAPVLDKISTQLQEMLLHIQDNLTFTTALEILEMGLYEYPSSALLYHHKGVLYFKNENLNHAEENLIKAAGLHADNEETHLYLGHIYSALDRFDQASLSYERVLSISNQNREAYRSLIRLSQRHNELDSLCNRWLQRYKNQSGNHVLKNFLIEALHRADRFDEARELLSVQ